MLNSEFRLLTIFLLLITFFGGSCFARTDKYSLKEFEKRFQQVKFNYKIAVNNLKYVERKADYDQYFEDKVLGYAFHCFEKNKKYFLGAEKKFSVSKFVILAVLTVESYCGHYVPKYNLGEVFKTLITLKKGNSTLVNKVYKKVTKKYPYIKRAWFEKRLKKKCKWAGVQLNALRKIFTQYKIDIFNVRSSWAGAFGLPQFLPTTFLYYAVDGNNDGKIDLWSMPDAIFSIANYFRENGWKEYHGKDRKIKQIFKYNHSKLYSKVIYELSELYRKEKGEF